MNEVESTLNAMARLPLGSEYPASSGMQGASMPIRLDKHAAEIPKSSADPFNVSLKLEIETSQVTPFIYLLDLRPIFPENTMTR